MRFAVLLLLVAGMLAPALGCDQPRQSNSSMPGGQAFLPEPGQAPPPALPDLVIAGVQRHPNSPIVVPGTSVRFTVQVQNRGLGHARGFVRIGGPRNQRIEQSNRFVSCKNVVLSDAIRSREESFVTQLSTESILEKGE